MKQKLMRLYKCLIGFMKRVNVDQILASVSIISIIIGISACVERFDPGYVVTDRKPVNASFFVKRTGSATAATVTGNQPIDSSTGKVTARYGPLNRWRTWWTATLFRLNTAAIVPNNKKGILYARR